MGGTFLSMAADYRAWFVAGLLDALSGHTSSGLAEAVRFSELARAKCVAITIETRLRGGRVVCQRKQRGK